MRVKQNVSTWAHHQPPLSVLYTCEPLLGLIRSRENALLYTVEQGERAKIVKGARGMKIVIIIVII